MPVCVLCSAEVVCLRSLDFGQQVTKDRRAHSLTLHTLQSASERRSRTVVSSGSSGCRRWQGQGSSRQQ